MKKEKDSARAQERASRQEERNRRRTGRFDKREGTLAGRMINQELQEDGLAPKGWSPKPVSDGEEVATGTTTTPENMEAADTGKPESTGQEPETNPAAENNAAASTGDSPEDRQKQLGQNALEQTHSGTTDGGVPGGPARSLDGEGTPVSANTSSGAVSQEAGMGHGGNVSGNVPVEGADVQPEAATPVSPSGGADGGAPPRSGSCQSESGGFRPGQIRRGVP